MRFLVDPPTLHDASKKFTELAVEYTGVYERLMDTASTMGQAWEAADNLVFVEQITGFCDDLEKMTQHLEQAAAALENQATNYETTRQNNIDSVKNLAN